MDMIHAGIPMPSVPFKHMASRSMLRTRTAQTHAQKVCSLWMYSQVASSCCDFYSIHNSIKTRANNTLSMFRWLVDCVWLCSRIHRCRFLFATVRVCAWFIDWLDRCLAQKCWEGEMRQVFFSTFHFHCTTKMELRQVFFIIFAMMKRIPIFIHLYPVGGAIYSNAEALQHKFFSFTKNVHFRFRSVGLLHRSSTVLT